ncbi:uncharacterized protein LOC110113433 [Dendrobium catenatum]|uniref:Sororin C-terminal region domain-containing protein n=1 Tax=Dendrobium catenatum TaxID=906689 RepID=A0A2I0XC34_9ASPA|nr:uncharacterized protein LOC110113433 [Dendrobium catenatum]PKU85472.1 hypothetical protein MA16_Dca003212 [Dendrobium catenatum]
MDTHISNPPRRKPLCDLTNAPTLSLPATSYKSKLRPRSSAVTNSSASSDVPDVSASCNSTAGSINPAKPVSGKVPASFKKGLQISSSSVSGAGNYESDEHSTLNMVQKKDKEIYVEKDNSAISAFSCPPLRKNRTTGRMKQVGGSLPGTNSVPFQKKKKRKRQIKPSEYKLPQDFINEHRAYFEEVDAFELHEEVISESELE